jgi:hypothetical protein
MMLSSVAWADHLRGYADGPKTLGIRVALPPAVYDVIRLRISHLPGRDRHLRKSSPSGSPCLVNCLRAMHVMTLPGSVTMI